MEIVKPISTLEEFIHLVQYLDKERWQKAKRRLILIRHGRTDWNEQGLLQGSKDLDILPSERDRINTMAESLRGVVPCEALIVSSTLRRAKQTARICAQVLGLSQQENPCFNEFNFGQWEGRRIEDLKMDSQHEFFLRNPILASKRGIPPGGENFLDFLVRVYQGINFIIDLNKPILLVTHAGVIRAVRFVDLIVSGVQVKEADFFFEGESFIKIPHAPMRLGEQGEFESVLEEI
ncbi:histidine phosphatase family protein [Persephonella sp.]